MNLKTLEIVESDMIKKHPDFGPGDTLEVSTLIREGGKDRVQIFRGIVIAMKGSGARKMFTIRKISYSVGVEKILPLHSPNLKKIKVIKKGKVRRAKLYYMRDRVGKLAMKIGQGDKMTEDGMYETSEEVIPEVKEEKPKAKKEEKVEVKKEVKAEKEEKPDKKKATSKK